MNLTELCHFVKFTIVGNGGKNMELWIRSQDKTSLTKIDNICIADNRIVFIPNNHNGRATLGTYKTNTRALEVLDEIQNKINLINLGHDFGSPMIDLKNPSYIYEMPKE